MNLVLMLTQRSRWRGNAGLNDLIPLGFLDHRGYVMATLGNPA
jgi:hypothetical protein